MSNHLSNLPPGVRECDIPGCSSADTHYEYYADKVRGHLSELGLPDDTTVEDDRWVEDNIADVYASDRDGDYEPSPLSVAECVIERWRERKLEVTP